jgi:hypothetical protein
MKATAQQRDDFAARMPLAASILDTITNLEHRQNAYAWAYHYYVQRLGKAYLDCDKRVAHAAKLGVAKATRYDNGLEPKTYGSPRRKSVLAKAIDPQQIAEDHVRLFHKLFAK